MIRFALASPSPLVRAGLAAGLAAQGDCEVVLSAATLAELVEAGYGGAAIVVVGVGAEGEGELDAVAPAGPRFVFLAAAADERVGEWLIDGCSVLPRGAAPGEVAGAARAALAGLIATTPGYATALRARAASGVARPADSLTPREHRGAGGDEPRLGNRDRRCARHRTPPFHVAQIIANAGAVMPWPTAPASPTPDRPRDLRRAGRPAGASARRRGE